MHDDEKDLSHATDRHAPEPEAPEPAAPGASAPAATKRRSRWPWVALTLALALFGLWLFWDWNWFKGFVEHRVTVATGRRFHIDGNLDVRVSMTPQVTMDHLRLENPGGWGGGTMASAQRLQFRVELKPMWHGETILPEVTLVRPVAHLEQRADSLDNWTFPGPASNPVIRRFTIENGLLTYDEPARRTAFAVAVQTDHAAGTASLAPLVFEGTGRYRANPFSLHGRADSPLELRNTATPYRIDVSATAGATHAHAAGALRNPLQASGFDVDFALSGPDLGLLYPLMGIALPESPPYHVQGRLAHAGHVWTYKRFAGIVGGSDLAGGLLVDNRADRRFMQATLASRRLDVHDLAGFVGAPAHANPSKAATGRQKAEAVAARAGDSLFPTHTFDLQRLRSMDTDVTLHARSVTGTPVPLSDFSTHFVLLNGIVDLDPFDFGAAGGQVRSKIRMDASRPVIATSAKIRAHGIDVARLVPNVPMIQRSAGTIGANLDLRGNGNSIAKMLQTSNGRASAAMGAGKVSDLMMARAALDIARILKLKISGDHDEPIRCVVADFAAKDGLWTANRLVLDSEDTVIRGTGRIDLRDETVDLTLKVKPRHGSLLSLRAPLYVTGKLAHPDIRPNYKVIGLRGAAVAVLGSIALPAAELGLIDIGGHKGSACARDEDPR